MKSGLTVQHLADSAAIVSLNGVVLYPSVSGFNTHIVSLHRGLQNLSKSPLNKSNKLIVMKQRKDTLP